MELGHVPAPLSFFSGMRKVPPAHFIVVDEGGHRLHRYWDFRHIRPDAALLKRSEGSLLDEFDELFQSAIRLRLLSDVPLGAFLSGGIDSALVVAGMKAVGVAEPNTFTIAFDEPEFDESQAASAIAKHIGVRHVAERLRASDLLALLPQVIHEFDEPLADSSAFPTMAVSRLARKHVAVALTGDGGDELFGGYHYYRAIEMLARVCRHPLLAHMVECVASNTPLHRARLVAGAMRCHGTVAMFHFMRSYLKDYESVLTADLLNATSASSNLYQLAASGFCADLTSAEIGMRLDTKFTLVDGYLQKVDVASMAFSLEARCPFMDFRIVEWAMRLPVQFKIANGQSKVLLRKLLCRYLPASMVYQPKRGFGLPIAAWLRGPLKAWAEALLNDRSLMAQASIDREQALKLFALHQSGKRDAHPMLWAMLMCLGFVAHHVNGESLPEVRAGVAG
jgi:asparagine synthase (glutamine-hydrolysing)